MPTKKKREEYGGSAYDQQYFTDDELRGAAAARAAAEAGETSWQDAHRYVEGIRNRYGYSGGENGSGYTPTGISDAPTYSSPYQRQIDELYDSIANRQPFSYDYRNDPLYQQYAESYERGGKRAMQDTLAEISARTGGLASSYAGTAANQAYNSYMAGLSDKIPALQQAAYDRYLREGDQQRDDLAMLQGMDATNYGRYQDALSQYNLDRNYKQALLDAAYDRQTQADKTAYDRQLALAQLGQSVGDYSGLNALGIQPNLDNLAAMTTAGSASLLRGSSGSSGATGSGRSSGSSGSARASGAADTEDSFWANVEDYAALGGDPADYIKANWKASGLFSSQTAALAAWNVRNTRTGASGTAAGMPESDFNREAQTIMQYLSQRMDDKAQNRINYIWDRLSAAQKQQLKAALAKNGIDIE